MTTKHTPGPWRWDWGEGRVGEIPRLYAGKEVVMEAGVDGFLMGEPRIVFNGDNAPANARLIAAATTAPHDCDDPKCPGAINKRKLEAFDDLLEALKAIIARRLESHETEAVYIPPEIELAYKAIAKAEGLEAK